METHHYLALALVAFAIAMLAWSCKSSNQVSKDESAAKTEQYKKSFNRLSRKAALIQMFAVCTLGLIVTSTLIFLEYVSSTSGVKTVQHGFILGLAYSGFLLLKCLR